jgi:hypothetical protein
MQNTVFILGAGASTPYGYPTGQELRDYICKEFQINLQNLINDGCIQNFDQNALDNLIDHAHELSTLFISQVLVPSIYFLHGIENYFI